MGDLIDLNSRRQPIEKAAATLTTLSSRAADRNERLRALAADPLDVIEGSALDRIARRSVTTLDDRRDELERIQVECRRDVARLSRPLLRPASASGGRHGSLDAYRSAGDRAAVELRRIADESARSARRLRRLEIAAEPDLAEMRSLAAAAPGQHAAAVDELRGDTTAPQPSARYTGGDAA